MIQRYCSDWSVKEIIQSDPVRPHIPAHLRNSPGHEVYGVGEGAAYCCISYCHRVPINETEMFQSMIGPIAVAYTVWSSEKGYGRKMIFAIRDLMLESRQVNRLVTLSPKTEMAMKFHIGNGAILLGEHSECNNFEYKLYEESSTTIPFS